MPRLDFATFLGIVCAFSLMLIAIMTGSSLALFINFPAFMIVIGGTFGALMVHFPFRDVFNSMAVSKNAFLYRESTPREVIDVLIEYASRARKEGLLALESVTNEVQDAFLAKGLQMAADGHEPKVLEDTLNREIEYVEDRHEKGADIFAALGAYAPAMGMIGTLIGLIQMLKTLDDPTTIGPAMALALITTLYGSVMANVIFLPMSGKLQIRSKSEVLKKTLILEGMKSILTGENPRVMEQKLHAFLAPRERESTFKR